MNQTTLYSYKDAKKRVKQLLENQPYGKAVSDTIQALQVAIITTVIAAILRLPQQRLRVIDEFYVGSG
ncbi:hypothetical protein [Guptibacillus algicola]|uniref:hypothetical protein n=1 Tax=Guptibacillus algicola TaxID=225844 RepID=UPI001CD2E1DD|nr:hypothetical protein [Alkalihalobacillus algicola]MCA0987373.1 hypothetical protein [Alkalihalobacillus algicola]